MTTFLHSITTRLCLWLCLIGLPCHAAPNILFLFSDDQRADTLSALGNPDIKTPALDQLVRSGTVFHRAYCMGSNNGAVCVPSRAMLMSGRSLFRVQEQLKGQKTWPEQFAEAGYTTFLTGKWHNGGESALRTFQKGKAVFLGGMGDPYKLALQDISATRTFENKRQSGEHSVKLFADAAVDFLKQQNGTQPFLCYVAFNAPHDPRVAPKAYHDRFAGHAPPLPANFLPQHPFNNGSLVIRDEALAPWPRTPEIVQQHLADYYASIEYLDAQIARILEALNASGQRENTLIVFSSDHGLAIGSHGLFGKQNLYDHSMRAPLIIAGPGVPQGKQSEAMCYLLDIFPTLGELAGVSKPEGSEGLSFAPVLKGTTEKHRETIFTSYTKVQRAVRDDRWKLIAYPQINRIQLFDLKNDPAEKQDLATDPQHAAERQRLTTLLQSQQQLAGDVLPLTTNNPLPQEYDFSTVKRNTKAHAGE